MLAWLINLTLAVVRLNPSQAIQAVVTDDPSSAHHMLHVSFLALWQTCPYTVRDQLVLAIETVLKSETIPSSVAETLLNLLEYMDIQGQALPLRTPLAASAADRHQLLSKAIFFRELEYRESAALPSSDCVESVIATQIKLGNHDSVNGILRSSASNFVRVRPSWHEKLENWQAALSSYSVRLLDEPSNPEWIGGRMRCLASLGEWDRLRAICENNPQQPESKPLQAVACFHLREWDCLKQVVAETSASDSFETIIYRASSLIHERDLVGATRAISLAKTRLSIPVPEGSTVEPWDTRLFNTMLQWDQVRQLEQVVNFFREPSDSHRERIRTAWNQRLLDLDYNVEVWRRLVPMRALFLDPFGCDIDVWVRFSTLCRKRQNLNMSERIVERLAERRPEQFGVILSRIKNVYAAGDVESAAVQLEEFLETNQLASQCTPYLLSKCWHALGLWLPTTDGRRVEACLAKSIRFDPSSYKAHSSFALVKFRQAQKEGFGPHVEEAVEALFRCILLSHAVAPLQDVLRLLTLWFSFYSLTNELDIIFERVFESAPLATWIQALPQILARLRSRRKELKNSITSLLNRIGCMYPQSVVFSLTVASRSDMGSLAAGAGDLLDQLRASAGALVSECELVAAELVRISSSWLEFWSTTLEEASRLYFVEKNIPDMIKLLSKAHAKLLSGPETPSEESFDQKFGAELRAAWGLMQLYIESDDRFYVEQAWGTYYSVFQRIHKCVGEIRSLSLARESPHLRSISNLSLQVPGGHVGVSIASLQPGVAVLVSKQRPRIIKIVGSNGRIYKYLLKGNEDLKQDERVMQLFRLINSVITDSVAARRRSGVFPTTPGVEALEHVQLKRFAVVPLSANAGLIEWVDGCDTLHGIIKRLRDERSIPLSLEHNLMRQVYRKYEDLPLLEKVMVLRSALSQTSGDELRNYMWVTSGGSTEWLKRRSMYARSLAVTSIVGYILGLGDRHPSNLMIEESTGQVIHIDFGDCFDVAATRERYPEKIPFRLTRQLVNALEISGIEGTFRITAERMMDLVRKNSDSIMAMLEALIYDPLITWRLIGSGQEDGNPDLLSKHAKTVVDRVHAKLAGVSQVAAQVDTLIREAMAHENICQCYVGWCPFW